MGAAFNPTARPGLAYQHAFDWVAVQLQATSGPVACLAPGPLAITELLRRVADVAILDAPEGVPGIAAALGLPWTPPGQPKYGSLAALAWVEPTAQDFVRLAEARRWLAPGGQLFLVVGGALAGYLAERKVGPSLDYLDERTALRGLARQCFRVTERLGLHGVRAVAWHLLGVISGRLGRADWQDRCHFAMRRDFVAGHGPAALACVIAEGTP